VFIIVGVLLCLSPCRFGVSQQRQKGWQDDVRQARKVCWSQYQRISKNDPTFSILELPWLGVCVEDTRTEHVGNKTIDPKTASAIGNTADDNETNTSISTGSTGTSSATSGTTRKHKAESDVSGVGQGGLPLSVLLAAMRSNTRLTSVSIQTSQPPHPDVLTLLGARLNNNKQMTMASPTDIAAAAAAGAAVATEDDALDAHFVTAVNTSTAAGGGIPRPGGCENNNPKYDQKRGYCYSCALPDSCTPSLVDMLRMQLVPKFTKLTSQRSKSSSSSKTGASSPSSPGGAAGTATALPVTSLHLCRSRLTDAGMVALASGVADNGTLTKLDLSNR
jgi:hypothetical protein